MNLTEVQSKLPALAAANVEVVAVSADTPERAAACVKDWGLTFPVGCNLTGMCTECRRLVLCSSSCAFLSPASVSQPSPLHRQERMCERARESPPRPALIPYSPPPPSPLPRSEAQMHAMGVYVSDPRNYQPFDWRFAEPAWFLLGPAPEGTIKYVDVSSCPLGGRVNVDHLLAGMAWVEQNTKEHPEFASVVWGSAVPANK